METSDKILIKLTTAFILVWAYLFIPYSETLHHCFPFNRQLITYQAYADYAFTRLALVILVWCIFDLETKYKEYIFVFLILWLGYLADYLLCYNQPYAHFYFIPIGYGLFAGLSMIFILLYKVLRK